MILYSFIIPIITCIILYIKFRRETVWWEYFVIFIPSILGSLSTYWVIQNNKVSDIKYYSEPAISVRHYDSWNEWIHKTCSKKVKTGENTYTTIHYDCSYCKNHPEYWELVGKHSKRQFISRKEFDYYRNLWKTPEIFIDCHRDYHTKDGDAQEYRWNGDITKAITIIHDKSYSNYFQSSLSLYNMTEISYNEAKKIGLYEYPKPGFEDDSGIWVYDQPAILSDSIKNCHQINDDDRRLMRWLNSLDENFRVFILLYPDSVGPKITDYQKSYWKGGNENEVVFCLGIDSIGKISWANSFSWSEEPRFEAEVLMSFLPGSKFDTPSFYSKCLEQYKSGTWKPRKFSEYSYISSELYTNDYVMIVIITVLINLLLSYYVINNEFKNS